MTSVQKAAAGVASLLFASSLAVPIVAKWEGLELVGYKDAVGIPTACAGHTATAVLGRRYTLEQCMDLLARDLVDHGVRIDRCISVAVPADSHAAFISMAYNVGPAAFCASTLVRRLNAGDLKGACAELSKWVYAGGKKLKGLENRRAEERAYCERGLQ